MKKLWRLLIITLGGHKKNLEMNTSYIKELWKEYKEDQDINSISEKQDGWEWGYEEADSLEKCYEYIVNWRFIDRATMTIAREHMLSSGVKALMGGVFPYHITYIRYIEKGNIPQWWYDLCLRLARHGFLVEPRANHGSSRKLLKGFKIANLRLTKHGQGRVDYMKLNKDIEKTISYNNLESESDSSTPKCKAKINFMECRKGETPLGQAQSPNLERRFENLLITPVYEEDVRGKFEMDNVRLRLTPKEYEEHRRSLEENLKRTPIIRRISLKTQEN